MGNVDDGSAIMSNNHKSTQPQSPATYGQSAPIDQNETPNESY